MPRVVNLQNGLTGTATGDLGAGVVGNSFDFKSFGSLGGPDQIFGQPAGVFGESTNQGVMGLATLDTGTGVYGGGSAGTNNFNGFGVRGETFNGVAVQGKSYGPKGL